MPGPIPRDQWTAPMPAETLARLRKLAWLLDSSVRVPGTRFRVGLDSLLGLIPGVGDVLGTAVSAYLLHAAWRHGVPNPVLGKMALNVAADLAAGAVPILGDVFDAAWKANSRNVALLEQALREMGPADRPRS